MPARSRAEEIRDQVRASLADDAEAPRPEKRVRR
jgi:hypothetical protein